MKKILLLALPLSLLMAASCTKDFEEEVKRPDKNSWFVNDKTFSAPAFTLDTFHVFKGGTLKKGSITIKFGTKPVNDGDYVVRVKADELNEISITVVDSMSNTIYQSMDDDGFQIKKEQFAKVTVNGGSVSVSFDNVWLKNVINVEKAKVSANLN